MLDATTQLLTPSMLDHTVEARHDVLFTRPLVPGLELHTRASAFAIRPGRGGDRMTLRVESRDGAGALVAEQFMTMAVRGLTGSAAAGPDIPGPDVPEAARQRLVGTYDVPFDADQTDRYAQASGDPIRIHLDDDFARGVGLPSRIGHGFCTMAMCSRAVLALAADGDPSRLRRLAVRFRAPVFPPSTVETRVHAGAEPGPLYFDAVSGGEVVISHGLAVLA
jgi:acyl dehydratase